jgi:hypothetical protein
VARTHGTGLVAAIMLAAATAGCAASGTASGPVAPGTASARTEAEVPLTGAKLSALIAAPVGFHVRTTPSPPGASLESISCASWWAGTYEGPGDVGSAVKEFTSSDRTTLTVIVSLLRHGDGTAAFNVGTAVPRRCAHFSYQDAGDHLWYRVDIGPASPAGLGDRSLTFDATETAKGAVFPSEVTYIQVGDASIVIDQTGPAGSAPNRVIPPLARLITTLRAAGY